MTATTDRTDADLTVARTTDEARPRVSWSAIFAGVFLVLAIELLLNLLGAGIGLGMVQPGSAASPDASSFSTGAGIWLLVSTIIAFLLGGLIAARMAGVASHVDGLLHGLVIWAVTGLFTVYLLGSAASGLISGTFSAVGGVASVAGQGIKSAAPGLAQAAGVDQSAVTQQVQSYLQPVPQDPAQMTSEQAQKAIASELPDYAGGGEPAVAAKQRIVSIMAAQQHISIEQAQGQFDQAQARFEHRKQQAISAATTAANETAAAASKGSFIAFFALLIGAVAAGIGGLLASPRRTVILRRRDAGAGPAARQGSY